MGRIRKTFTAKTPRGRFKGKALVDTGADRTVLPYEAACRLGMKPAYAETAEARGWDSKGVPGYVFPVEVHVGKKKALVNAFVPARGHRSDPVIGHDFMQAAKVKIDFAPEPHTFDDVYEGGTTYRPVRSARVRKALRLARCPIPGRKRRR